FPVWLGASVFSVGRAHHLFRSHAVESCLGESRLLPSTVRTSVGPTARASRRSAPSRPREIDRHALGNNKRPWGQNARASGQTDSRPCTRSPDRTLARPRFRHAGRKEPNDYAVPLDAGLKSRMVSHLRVFQANRI